MIIDVLEYNHPDRYQAELFIHDRFDMEYNADVRNYMPHLVRLQTRDGKPVAIVGYRDAARHRLFLEHYFDEPIEDVLSASIGQRISRDKIVEVGNLADAQPGGARAAITALTAYLYGAGFRWVVFTGVKKLRNAFFRLGLEPLQIGVADINRLTRDEQHEWGRYYLAGPRIMAGDIHEGYFALEFTRKVLQPLWNLALDVGKRQCEKRKVA
jgi:hypothetical protein